MALGGEPLGLVPAGDALYSLGLAGSTGAVSPPASATVVRIDVATRREAIRAYMPRPVVSGSISAGGLYVILSEAGSGRTAPATLVRLDATTLRIRAQVTLRVQRPSAVARVEGIYVLDGPRLERRDPVTLAVTGSLGLPVLSSSSYCDGGRLAADPRTDTGWAAITQQSGGFRVAEIDLSRLALVHLSEEIGGVCGATLTAMIDGVWAGFATGMLSDAVRLASATGEVDARLHPADADRLQQPNSAVYQVSATELWVNGGRSLSCADLHTGLVLGTTGLGDTSGAVSMVADMRHVFISAPDGIAVYTPTGPCRADPVASGRQVTLAYVGPGVGVVGVDTAAASPVPSRLYLTADFSHWRDVTPPQVAADPAYPSFEGAFFLDATRGWVTTFSPANIEVVIYRTVDGGHRWARLATTYHTMHPGAIIRLQFLTASVGFMEREEPTGPVAQLSDTVDGGAHWTLRNGTNMLPVADIRFLDQRQAIATGPQALCFDGSQAQISRSSDGGRSWATSVLPAAYTGSTTGTCVGEPFIAGARRVLIPITSISDTGSRVGFLVSDDGGASWRTGGGLATPFSPARGDGHQDPGAPLGAVAPDGSWWVVGLLPTASPSVATATDQGLHWRTAAARGLTGVPLRLIARSARAAWALVLDGADVRLCSSTDRGDTWVPVDPGQAAR